MHGATRRIGLGAALVAVMVASPALGQAMKKADPPTATAAPQPAGLTVAAMFPPGGAPGKTVPVTIDGANLAGASSLWFGHPGITGKLIAEGASDAAVKAEVAVAADVPPGLYPWRLAGPKGVSAPKMFAVGAGEEVVSDGSNRDPAKPRAISPGQSVNGRLDKYDDIEHFTLSVAKPNTRVILLVKARQLGSVTEAAVAILDAKGKVAALPKHGDRIGGDPFIDAVLPEAGDYSVQVWNLSPGDSRGRVFRLTYLNRPLIAFAYPAGVRRGTSSQVELGLRDPNETVGRRLPNTPYSFAPVTVNVPADWAEETFPVRLAEGPGSHNIIRIAVGELQETPSVEPGDEPAKATPLTIPCTVNGRLIGRGSQRFFKAALKKGQTVVLDVDARKIGSPGDLAMTVSGPGPMGPQVAANDDASADDPDPRLSFTAPADGDYFVKVAEAVPERITGPEHVFRLTAREPHPDFALTLPAHTVMAATPGPAVVPVNFVRIDGHAEPIQLVIGVDDFKGVHVNSLSGPGGGAVVLRLQEAAVGRPVTLQIFAESRVGGKLAKRTATAAVELARADGIQPAHVVRVDTVAVGAVAPANAAAVPLAITAAPDKVDAPTAGAVTVKVTAARSPVATGPIDVTVLAGPDGAAAGKVQIPAGQPSADLALKLTPAAVSGPLVIAASTKAGTETLTAYALVTVNVAAAPPTTVAAKTPDKTPAPATPDAKTPEKKAEPPAKADPKTPAKPDPAPATPAKIDPNAPFAGQFAATVTGKVGGTADLPVKVIRRPPFAASVRLGATGLPQGYQAPIVRVGPEAGEGVLKIVIPPNAKPGTYPNITVTGLGKVTGDTPTTLPLGTITLVVEAK